MTPLQGSQLWHGNISACSRTFKALAKSYTIAITGKGGTGKTTIAAAIVACLIDKGMTPVLAVDADPNSCLDQVLGVEVRKTVGRIREESRDASSQATGIAKRELVELRIAEGLVEGNDFDLIAMGRPEGPGCYCYANNLFSDVISELSSHYPFIVLDNEAGLENLSRRLYKKTDLLVIVGDPSKRGLQTIRRLYELAREMDIAYDRLAVVVNMLRTGEISEEAAALANEVGADFILGLPFDPELSLAAEQGRSMLAVDMANPILSRVSGFISGLRISGE
ncbi:carbon monoxide dehydrogenase [bacterium]|nr:carbon monoxide dehydrogenase [bacterium]